jgi:uncharacterized protein (TIGR03435 family)
MQRILLAAILATVAAGQSTAPLPEFEVASVKPTPPPDPAARSETSTVRLGSGRVTAENATLKMILIKAYGVKDYQIQGPDWIFTERYNIQAKAPAGAPDSQLPLMLQRLLAERFRLELHRGSQEMRLYDLVVASKGLKLAKAEKETGMSISGQLVGDTTMPRFADALALVLRVPVVDRTNTSGIFEVKVIWESDDPTPSPAIMSDALQRLAGLRLEARKGPIEMLMVDRADRIPKEN